MQKYFFHTVANGVATHDEDGTALPDEAAAWHEASSAFGEMIKEVDGEMQIGSEWTMQVESESGPVFVITLTSSRVG